MKNKTVLGLIALSIVAILGVGLISAFQFGECMGGLEISEEEQGEMQAFQESIQQAIENEDFNGWKTLMESQLTQERFNEMVERHNENSERQKLMEQMQEAWETEDYGTLKQLKGQLDEDRPIKMQNQEGEFQHRTEFRGKEGFFHRFQFWDRD